MRIAYYAPMKAPTCPSPSGDRQMARLLIRALTKASYKVELASTFRSWEGRGEVHRQRRLRDVGERLAQHLVRRYRARPAQDRPALWFSYHSYHKAPDWLGPKVSRGLGIPYIVAEASFAPKQADGPWSLGHQGAAEAIAHADAVIALNSNDIPCVRPLLRDRGRLVTLKPFLDTAPYTSDGDRERHRAALVRRFALDPEAPWLLVVAMMRKGDKLASYAVLGAALERLKRRRWSLIVVGDGAARSEVQAVLEILGRHRVLFVGRQSWEALAPYYGAADLYVWPAVNEAYGMSLLEAQAAGLAVVAGRTGGVADIVRDGVSGLLVPEGDAVGFAAAVDGLLDAPAQLRVMGEAARELVTREHDLGTAAAILDRVLRRVRVGALP